ncbi:MAG: prephenate dehydrogenase [Candidatus Omnitrophota bacterium]|nr:MAG: prephenate dehydrogenase [Candidatus Omnitrophota bacterium]
MRKKVAIIGAGFMGGSLALDLREKFSNFVIWGYARSQSSYRRIKKSNVVDKVERDLNRVVGGADFVVLALPVFVIIDYLKRIAPLLKKGAIVFDLGSSKEFVERAAKKYMPKGAYFVGCHPLCGAEKGGVEFSSRGLYNGAHCIITASSGMKATKVVAGLWQELGTKVTYIRPQLHDKILSSVSHLPHLISFSITEFISKHYLKFSSRSLKDLTRISNSPSSVWTDIFLSNKANLRRDLQGFIKVLRKFDAAIKEGDRRKIINLIKKVNKKQKLLSDTV